MKIKIKTKEREVYGAVGEMVLYKGGYYTYIDNSPDSIYQIVGANEDGVLLIQSIGRGTTPYEKPEHHFWKTRWRESTPEEVKRYQSYEDKSQDKASGS